MSEKARRYNKGKLRYVLFPTFAKKAIIDVYTKGAHKYSIYKDKEGKEIKGMDIPFEDRGKYELIDDASGNWRKGLSWIETLDSINRHEEAFKAGEDMDPELLTYHAANAAWGWITILEYYKIYPQGDDRKHGYLNRPKIGLDIDGVICDFNTAYADKFCPNGIHSWNCHFDTKEHLDELTKTDEFYMSLKPLCNPKEIPFEPHCYITSRSVPQKWTEEWLFQNGFPTRPVYSIPFGASKIEIARKSGIDIFVDDRYENFVEMNNAGICTFLFDASHNKRYEVGYKRIKSLKELI